MTTHIGIGFSQDIDVQKAAQKAAQKALEQAQTSKIDFALVLSSIHYPPDKTLPIIQQILNPSRLIGSSTAGIILSHSIKTRGLAILTITSSDIKCGIGKISFSLSNIDQLGVILAQNSLKDFNQQGVRQMFLFFMDTQTNNNSLFLKGIQDVLGNAFPIIGAGSSDDFHISNTFQLFQNTILTQSAVGLILGGHVGVGIGSRHGWKPLGKPRIITKCHENIIHQINGKKASFLYEEYFGNDTKNVHSTQFKQMTILYPLGLLIDGNPEYLLRNAIDILPDGSIVCQGDIPKDAEVHIMLGNKDSCKQAAIQAANEAKKNLFGKEPKLIIILESMARLKLLGRMAFQEIQRIKEIFGSNTPLIGMYTHGEIAPLQTIEKIKKSHVQNESMVILAIG